MYYVSQIACLQILYAFLYMRDLFRLMSLSLLDIVV